MDIWNSDFVLNTNATSSLVSLPLICTFLFQGVHGILISVPYLLCHYAPTIEVYWNGPKLFCVSVRINKKSKVQSQQYDTHAQLKYHFLLIFIALTSRIVFSNDPAFALRTLSALETNASAPILLNAAQADLVTTF